MNNIDKARLALRDMIELHNEVRDGLFLPKRFRKMDFKRFQTIERPKYVAYLAREITNLERHIVQAEKRLAY